jgi:single-strand DNA-binding protein
MSLPTLTGVGRLVADPELRFSSNGTAICKVSIAFNARKRDDAGNWVDGDSHFAYGTAFNKLAEGIAESLNKGMEVVVTGRLKTRQYETKEGEKRSVVELLLDSIGPNLAFATAKVTKASSGNGGGQRAAAGDPWEEAAPANTGRGGFDDTPPF